MRCRRCRDTRHERLEVLRHLSSQVQSRSFLSRWRLLLWVEAYSNLTLDQIPCRDTKTMTLHRQHHLATQQQNDSRRSTSACYSRPQRCGRQFHTGYFWGFPSSCQDSQPSTHVLQRRRLLQKQKQRLLASAKQLNVVSRHARGLRPRRMATKQQPMPLHPNVSVAKVRNERTIPAMSQNQSVARAAA